MTNKKENRFILEQYTELSTAEVVAVNKATGVEMFMATLESDELNHEVEEETIKGGIYNDTIVTINKNKTITFKFTDPVSRMDIQMNKLGAELKNGSVTACHFPKVYTVVESTGKKVTLSETPLDPKEFCVYNTKTNKALIHTTDYTVEGKEITIKSETIKVGDDVFVTSFRYTKTAVDYADIGNTVLPQVFELRIRKPLYDKNDAIVFWKEYHVPSAKMSGSFTLTGNTDKTKNTEETTFTVQRDIKAPYLMRLMLVPNDEVV